MPASLHPLLCAGLSQGHLWDKKAGGPAWCGRPFPNGSCAECLPLCCHDQCLCTVFKSSFSQSLAGFSWYQSLLQSVDGTNRAGDCPAMMFPSALPFSPPTHLAVHHLGPSSCFVVSWSWIVALTLCSPQPPSGRLLYNLWTLDLVYNPACTVRNFLVLVSVTSVSFFSQLISPVGYLMTAWA